MVDSPAYPCQFVLVVKLTAVLNDECVDTAARCCGLNGRRCWRRWKQYVTSTPMALKTSMMTVYAFQPCVSSPLRPHSLSSKLSIGPNTRGSGRFGPSKARCM